MKSRMALTLSLLFLLMLIDSVYAADGSFTDQFLGSPLLIFVALVVIDIIVFIYRKIRK